MRNCPDCGKVDIDYDELVHSTKLSHRIRITEWLAIEKELV